MTDALIVAAAFNGITRVADATGIPLDPTQRQQHSRCASKLVSSALATLQKSARYDL